MKILLIIILTVKGGSKLASAEDLPDLAKVHLIRLLKYEESILKATEKKIISKKKDLLNKLKRAKKSIKSKSVTKLFSKQIRILENQIERSNKSLNGDEPKLDQVKHDEVKHETIGKKITLANRYDKKYTGGGDGALTDGKLASKRNAGDRAWQGFKKQDLDAIIDLGGPMSVNGISTGFLHQPRIGINLPSQVEYAISRDGKTYEIIGNGKITGNGIKSRDIYRARNTFRLDGLDLHRVRYIRVRAKFVIEWLLADEIIINPIGINE